MLHGGAVTWNSKRQPTVALSTTEAEYMALGQATKESAWIKRLLVEIGFHQQNQPAKILSDNQGAISLTKKLMFHSQTKHIDIQHHFLCEKSKASEIRVVHCRTENMLADVLTKALSRDKHQRFMAGMGLKEGRK